MHQSSQAFQHAAHEAIRKNPVKVIPKAPVSKVIAKAPEKKLVIKPVAKVNPPPYVYNPETRKVTIKTPSTSPYIYNPETRKITVVGEVPENNHVGSFISSPVKKSFVPEFSIDDYLISGIQF